MDPNKRRAMHEIGFRLVRTCANCKHVKPPDRYAEPGWLQCARHAYSHGTRNIPKRLPANVFGVCESHDFNPEELEGLRVYEDFINGHRHPPTPAEHRIITLNPKRPRFESQMLGQWLPDPFEEEP